MFHDRLPETFQALPTSAERRRNVWSALLPRRGRALARIALSAGLAVTDMAAIVAVTLGLECAYHAIAQDSTVWAGLVRGLRLSALLALVIVATNVLREEYSLENVMAQKPGIQRVASLWLIAWAAVLVVSFMTKTTNDYSRLVSLGIFAAGLPVLIGARAAVRRLVRERLSAGSATASRIHLVGYEEDIARFYAGKEVDQLGSRIIGTSYLRRVDPGADAATRHDQLQEDLDLAVSVVRFLRPDDVFVLVPWADTAEVERCIDAFLRVPSALHLRPGAVLDRFPDLQVARVGGVSGINIGRRPLNVGVVML